MWSFFAMKNNMMPKFFLSIERFRTLLAQKHFAFMNLFVFVEMICMRIAFPTGITLKGPRSWRNKTVQFVVFVSVG